MLNLPHKGIAPDMLGEVRPLLGVVGLDKARQELEHTDGTRVRRALHRRRRPANARAARRRARRELARHDPPGEAIKANARLNGRTTATIEDVREMAPYVLRHRIVGDAGDTSVDTVLLDAMAACRRGPPPVSPVSSA